jgi:hypothetical protein
VEAPTPPVTPLRHPGWPPCDTEPMVRIRDASPTCCGRRLRRLATLAVVLIMPGAALVAAGPAATRGPPRTVRLPRRGVRTPHRQPPQHPHRTLQGTLHPAARPQRTRRATGWRAPLPTAQFRPRRGPAHVGHRPQRCWRGNERTIQRHGTLSSYRLSTGRRQTWKLPPLALLGAPDIDGSGPEVQSPGVYGYSTHTANTVFWIATRTVKAAGVTSGLIVETSSSVYAASVNSVKSVAVPARARPASGYRFEDLRITRQVAADGKPIPGFVSYYRSKCTRTSISLASVNL